MNRSASDLAFRSDQRHPWVEALFRCVYREGEAPPERAIAAEDEMLEFGTLDHGGDGDVGLAGYFLAGHQVSETVLAVIGQWFGALDDVPGLLDFGSGHGRVTRYFVRALGADRVTAAEIVPGMLSFQERRLGVATLASAHDPRELPADRRFGAIYVGSLFTHLPEATFGPWLAALTALLEPGGVLAFTVHDERLMPPDLEMTDGDLAFRPSSESRTIDHTEYGSTWVRPAFVERVLGSLGGDWAWRRFPRAICGYQDLWLVAEAGLEHRLRAVEIEPGVEAQVDRCELSSDRDAGSASLVVGGWAATVDGEQSVEEVALELAGGGLDGEDLFGGTAGERPPARFAAPVDRPLPAVAEALDRPAETPLGFCLRAALPVPLSHSRAVAILETRSRSGHRTIVWVGSLERLLHRTARENHLRYRQRVYELADVVTGMKRSAFWRLRRLWFVLKRGVGLTDEDPAGPHITDFDRRPEEEEGGETGEGDPPSHL